MPPHLPLPCSSFWQGQLADAPHEAEAAAPPRRGELPELWFIYGFMVLYKICFQQRGESGAEIIGGSLQLAHRNVCGAVSALWAPSLRGSFPFSTSLSGDNGMNWPAFVFAAGDTRKASLGAAVLGSHFLKARGSRVLCQRTTTTGAMGATESSALCSCVLRKNIFETLKFSGTFDL